MLERTFCQSWGVAGLNEPLAWFDSPGVGLVSGWFEDHRCLSLLLRWGFTTDVCEALSREVPYKGFQGHWHSDDGRSLKGGLQFFLLVTSRTWFVLALTILEPVAIQTVEDLEWSHPAARYFSADHD